MSRMEKGGGKAAVDSESWMVDRLERERKTNSRTSLSLTATRNPLSYLSEHRTQNTKNIVPPFSKGETIW